MTQTLEAITQAPMSPAEFESVAYDRNLSPIERAPYVVAHDLMSAAQKANELSQQAQMLSGEERGMALNQANFTLEYAALCAALPVHQKVRKEPPYSNNPNLARAWVPYPNRVVTVDVFPVAVMDVLHEQALYEHDERPKQTSIEVEVLEPSVSMDIVGGEQVPVIDVLPEQVQSRRRGFARALGWFGLNRLAHKQ